MIPQIILERTFQIRYLFGGEKGKILPGSAFTFEKSGKQFLASVAHIFPFCEDKQEVEFFIMREGAWQPIKSTIFKHGDKDVDIVVLDLPSDISPRNNIEMSPSGMILGQPTYFLGFPYGKNMATDINNGYPIPFVKQAPFSGMSTPKPGEKILIYYMDGINNFGFSGGPCIFWHMEKNIWSICGIVKGYLPELIPINTGFHEIEIDINTGIMEVHSISYLLQII